mmetsp:Transcript_17366/g.44074  ORF Transcript_17366/g.44074 Transcript_17366/m.44074 type:complete len:296 (+) Transcript_17366:133-1020(+)
MIRQQLRPPTGSPQPAKASRPPVTPRVPPSARREAPATTPRRRPVTSSGPPRPPNRPATRAKSSHGRDVEAACGSGLPPLLVFRMEDTETVWSKLQNLGDDPSFSDFNCPICFEPFWRPVRTVCDHRFCQECLLMTILMQLTSSGTADAKPSCPICRHLLRIDKDLDTAGDFPLDAEVMSAMKMKLSEKYREERPIISPARGSRPVSSSLRSRRTDVPRTETAGSSGFGALFAVDEEAVPEAALDGVGQASGRAQAVSGSRPGTTQGSRRGSAVSENRPGFRPLGPAITATGFFC